MRKSFWGDQIGPIVAAALEGGRAEGLAGKALERHVQAARPHWCRGTEGYAPIKAWRREFNRQVKGVVKQKPRPPVPGQGLLFPEAD